jgi:biopolymer transport protein ExbD
MAMPVPEVEETQLNMTPMIDVVFQLVTFFLLTLHFAAPEDRIDSELPKDRGLSPTPTIVKDFENIKVKLFRKNKENLDEAVTKIKIGNNWEIMLPKGRWPVDSNSKASKDFQKEYDKVLAIVVAKIKEEWQKQNNSLEVHGEISAPPPDGPAVPHGDVVRILDSFLSAGLTLINFEGAGAPLPTKEGGSMYN